MRVEVYWSHSFLPDLIRPDGVVFDFGVYDGGFARLVAPRCARVVGFEPDPTWRGELSLPPNVYIVPKVLAAKGGAIPFYMNVDSCSSLHYTEPKSKIVKVEAVTLAEALALEPEKRIDLIKM